MGVDLCGREVAVTEQELHYPQIGTAVQEMRCECVSQAVRRQLLADTRLLCIALDDVPERLARHTVSAAGREQVVTLPLEQDLHARAFDEILEPSLRLLAERDQAFAVALADEDALVEIDLRLLEVDELRYPQSGGIQQLEHRPVTVPKGLVGVGRVQQGIDLFLAQRLRQRASDSRHFDFGRRVRAAQTFTHGIAIKPAEARKLSRRRARLGACFHAAGYE